MVLGKRKADGGQLAEGVAPAAKKQHYSSHRSKSGPGAAVLSRAERAALRKERRASKPHHDLIENANQLYRFDFKRMDATERRAKIAELMERTAGRVVDVLTKHDTSRVFQLLVKYGSGQQRQRLCEACKGSFVALCVDHYAHHFVLKLLQYGSPVVRQSVWRELQGHVSQLASHADGAVVFDYLYASERSKKQQLDMTRELLHPSFALDARTAALTSNADSGTVTTPRSGGGELADWCQARPALASAMVQHVGGLVDKWLNKTQLQYRFVHGILRQYLELPTALLPRSSRSELLSSLCSSPSLSALCGSNDGVLVLCMAVSDGLAKDRKQVMRCLKSDPLSVCRSLCGHLLLMRIVDCVDDTVAVDKNVWTGLLATPYAVSQLISDVHGAKVVRFMLQGKASSQFLSPFEATFQQRTTHNTVAVSGNTHCAADGSSMDAEGGYSSGGSKKDGVLRHKEHLAHCLLPLLSVFQLDDFIRDNPAPLTASQLAAQAVAADRREEEAAVEQAGSSVSLDLLLRSPSASPVLLDLLHTAQATMQAEDGSVKATALSTLRPQLQHAVDAALDQLALVVQPTSEQNHTKEVSGGDEHVMEGTPAVSGSSQSRSSLLEDKTAHYFFKRLLTPLSQSSSSRFHTRTKRPHTDAESDKPTSADAALLGRHFAQRLLNAFHTSPALLSAAASSNRGCFVLLALIDAIDSTQQHQLAQLCKQHAVYSTVEAAIKQHDEQRYEQQGQSVVAAGKRRRRASQCIVGGDAASVANASTDEGGSIAAMTGCRLLQAWLDEEQTAISAASEEQKGSAKEVRVTAGQADGPVAALRTRGGRAVVVAASPPSGLTATVSKQSRQAAKRL